MTCDINKIDSNVTVTYIAEEECLKTLPGVDEADAVWYELETNSYSDFGAEYTTVSRAPINVSRQNQKGLLTSLEASAGFNIDLTGSNMTRNLQGFFFADARELPATNPYNGTLITISAVDSATKTYTVDAGGAAFVAGQLIFADNFGQTGNDGLKSVASSTATTVVVNETLVNEAAPPATAEFRTVGFELTADDIDVVVVDNIPSLTSTTTDFTALPGLFAGLWIHIGGDATDSAFDNNVGYGRIKSIETNSLSFDDTTFTAVNEDGTGKTIRIFVGTAIKNENTLALIKRRSYNIERQLGLGAVSTQAQYLIGSVASELTVNLPQEDKMTVDLKYVSLDETYRSGNVDDEIKTGTRVAALGENAINTSSDVYRIKMSIIDPLNSNPTALFGFISEGNLTINNNLATDKGVGVIGGFDMSTGNFEVGGSVTAYFTEVAAVQAIRNNPDIGINIITAVNNIGIIWDVPLLGLGGGRLTVEKDRPVMMPLTNNGYKNANGYTLLYEAFAYLPDIAMAE